MALLLENLEYETVFKGMNESRSFVKQEKRKKVYRLSFP
jgi:hypothetical protein